MDRQIIQQTNGRKNFLPFHLHSRLVFQKWYFNVIYIILYVCVSVWVRNVHCAECVCLSVCTLLVCSWCWLIFVCCLCILYNKDLRQINLNFHRFWVQTTAVKENDRNHLLFCHSLPLFLSPSTFHSFISSFIVSHHPLFLFLFYFIFSSSITSYLISLILYRNKFLLCFLVLFH